MRPIHPTHRMYIDEVGNPSVARLEPLDNRFFSLTAAVIELKHEPHIAQDLAALKLKYFGSDRVILHRNDIENARAIFGKLAYPQLRQDFNAEVVTLLNSWSYTIITACVDKASMSQSGKAPSNFYHLCFGAILERYVSLLRENSNYGDIMLEGRGKSEDIALEWEFNRLWSKQRSGVNIQQVLTSKHLKIRPKSANEAGLQLANLLAYPSYREILALRGLLSTEQGLPDMTKQLVSVVAGRYYRSNEATRGRIFLG